MSRPRVVTNFIPSPIPSPSAAAQRIPAIIGEGSLSFSIVEKVTRFALGAPASPAVSNLGAAGSTTWTYKVTSITALGESVQSVAATTTTGNAVLDTTNYNQITWTAVTGATGYNVYRTAAGGTPATLGLIGTTTSLSLDDKGLAATATFQGSRDILAHAPLAITRVGDYTTTTNYASGTDYVMNATGLAWNGGLAPAAGATYYVAYSYAKVAADYEPKYFTDFNSVLNQCGPVVLDANGALTPASYLTMAAQIMMGAGIGANQLIIVQINPATAGAPVATDFTDALAKLVNSVGTPPVDPYYVTPLGGKLSDGDVATVNSAFLNHAIQMADPAFGKERRIYTGLKNNSSFSAAVTAANGLQVDTVNSGRLTLMLNYDPYLSVSFNGTTTPVLLDGFFAAAALAAYRSTQQVSQPALNKLLPVFTGFNTAFSSTQIDTADNNGLEVLENDGGSIRTVNDVTVNVVNDVEKSIPTVETRDNIAATLRKRLYSRFVGLRGSPTIPSKIERDVDAYLDDERANGDIQDASPAKANRVANTLTKYAVSFSYLPAGEVLEITVNFSIDLNLA